MKQFISKYLGWLLKSNRQWHLICAIVIGATIGFIPAVAVAFALEFKDWMWNGSKGTPFFGWKTANGFDWLDLLATVIGGAIGALSGCFNPNATFLHGLI